MYPMNQVWDTIIESDFDFYQPIQNPYNKIDKQIRMLGRIDAVLQTSAYMTFVDKLARS